MHERAGVDDVGLAFLHRAALQAETLTELEALRGPEMRALVPAVVHVDGTGRPQSVRREWNERFHHLVSDFHELTGIPIVLNTSLNIMGKPMVHSVEDAIALFFTTGLDALVIEDQDFVKS